MEADKYNLTFWYTSWNKRHVEIRNKRNLFKMHYVNLHVELDVFEDIYNKWLQIRRAWEKSDLWPTLWGRSIFQEAKSCLTS